MFNTTDKCTFLSQALEVTASAPNLFSHILQKRRQLRNCSRKQSVCPLITCSLHSGLCRTPKYSNVCFCSDSGQVNEGCQTRGETWAYCKYFVEITFSRAPFAVQFTNPQHSFTMRSWSSKAASLTREKQFREERKKPYLVEPMKLIRGALMVYSSVRHSLS